jgi:hypothetical protein
LDPSKNPTLCLPPSETLAADLSAPRWKTAAGGKLVIETKDEIKKRLGRSPDEGDSVILVNWLQADLDFSPEESSFDWVDKPLRDVEDVYGTEDWVPAPDEPSLEVTLTSNYPRDTSLMGW